jgi:FG-GAP-like repeat
VADYDGDGRADLISGSSCCESPNCFSVFRRQKDGGFGERRRVNLRLPNGDWALGGGNGLRTKVAVADWNGDGVPDVLIGNTETRYVGVAYGPLVDKDELTVQRLWPKGQEPFQRMTTNPCVADWDGDGLADLVVGGYKEKRDKTQGVYWLRNVGTKQEPTLAEPRLLIADELLPSTVLLGTTGVCVADWNGDGRPDLIASRLQRDGPPKSATRQHRVWVYLRQAR